MTSAPPDSLLDSGSRRIAVVHADPL